MHTPMSQQQTNDAVSVAALAESFNFRIVGVIGARGQCPFENQDRSGMRSTGETCVGFLG
jgi:hypothetical protein